MRRARVLLADDTPKDREYWGGVLRNAGYNVIEASSVAEAQEVLRKGELDLAVLDRQFNRNQMAGLELAASAGKDVPVIILSYRPNFQAALDAWKQGIFGYILKNNDEPQVLLDAVRRALVRVFVVHGHDDGAKISVVHFLEKSKLRPIVLSEQSGRGRVILEKFEDYADVTYYAIALLTPDDEGKSIKETDTKKRARQNVILELGFFMGALGRGRVSYLVKEENGRIEIPSDCAGIEYITMDSSGSWRSKLAKEMEEAGIELDTNWL